MMSENYYNILGVPRNSTSKQIRERFLQLARDRHPDRYGDEEKEQAEIDFQKITQAYNVLHDAGRRREYDHDLELQAKGASKAPVSEAARVYLQRGLDAYKKKRFRESFDNIEQATREDPQDSQAWYHLAKLCSERPSWRSRGLAAATKACELEPMNATYLKLAGLLAMQAGMTAEAMKYYRDALTFGGDDAEVRGALKRLRKGGG